MISSLGRLEGFYTGLARAVPLIGGAVLVRPMIASFGSELEPR